MDAEFQGLLWTLGLNAMFFVFALVVWDRLRVLGPPQADGDRSETRETSLLLGSSKDVMQRRGSDGVADSGSPESETFFSPLWARVFGQLPVTNNAAFLYLRFMEMIICALALMTVVFCALLLPIYISGANRVAHPTWLQLVSAGNVPTGQSTKLYTVFFCTLMCSVLCYAILYYFRETVKHVSQRSLSIQLKRRTRHARALERYSHHCVHLSNLNRLVTDESILQAYFEGVMPGRVRFVHICLNLDALSDAYRERKRVKGQIERYSILEDRQGGKPIYIGGFCGCCGYRAVEYFERRKDEMRDVIRSERAKGAERGTGHAFIVFDELPDLDVLRPTLLARIATAGRGGSALNDEEWEFKLAPPPSDIKWENMSVTPWRRSARAFFITLGLFFLMVVIVTPVSLLGMLHPVLHSVKNSIAENPSNPVRVLITQFTPPLIIFLINSGILPVLVDMAAAYERHYLYSLEEASIFKKNYFFLLLSVVVIPTLALNSLQAFVQFTYNAAWTDWTQVVGHSLLSSSGHFAIQYVLNAGFIGAAAQLLDLPQQISLSWKLYWAVTPAEIAAARKRWVFEFGYWYAVRATIFGMVLLYSVSVPVILPFGLLYFVLVYKVDRYNFSAGIYRFKWETSGELESKVGRFTLVSLAMFQFAMAAFFGVQKTHSYYTASLILTLLFFFTVFLYYSKHSAFKPRDHHFSSSASSKGVGGGDDEKADLEDDEDDEDDVQIIILKNELQHDGGDGDDEDENILPARLSDEDEEEVVDSMPLWQVYTHPLSREPVSRPLTPATGPVIDDNSDFGGGGLSSGVSDADD